MEGKTLALSSFNASTLHQIIYIKLWNVKSARQQPHLIINSM